MLLDAGLVTELSAIDQVNVKNLFKTMCVQSAVCVCVGNVRCGSSLLSRRSYYRDGKMAGDLLAHISANHVNVDQAKFQQEMSDFFSNVCVAGDGGGGGDGGAKAYAHRAASRRSATSSTPTTCMSATR